VIGLTEFLAALTVIVEAGPPRRIQPVLRASADLPRVRYRGQARWRTASSLPPRALSGRAPPSLQPFRNSRLPFPVKPGTGCRAPPAAHHQRGPPTCTGCWMPDTGALRLKTRSRCNRATYLSFVWSQEAARMFL
jgi:hypothetical protein